MTFRYNKSVQTLICLNWTIQNYFMSLEHLDCFPSRFRPFLSYNRLNLVPDGPTDLRMDKQTLLYQLQRCVDASKNVNLKLFSIIQNFRAQKNSCTEVQSNVQCKFSIKHSFSSFPLFYYQNVYNILLQLGTVDFNHSNDIFIANFFEKVVFSKKKGIYILSSPFFSEGSS